VRRLDIDAADVAGDAWLGGVWPVLSLRPKVRSEKTTNDRSQTETRGLLEGLRVDRSVRDRCSQPECFTRTRVG
jgi:hypothetical protein